MVRKRPVFFCRISISRAKVFLEKSVFVKEKKIVLLMAPPTQNPDDYIKIIIFLPNHRVSDHIFIKHKI